MAQQFNIYQGTHNIADIDTALDRVAGLDEEFNAKQSKLISGTNIKTINGESLLGSGNISIAGTVTDEAIASAVSNYFTTHPIEGAAYQLYEQDDYEDLTESDMQEGILYCEMEAISTPEPEPEPSPTQTISFSNNIISISTGVTLSGNTVTVENATYNNNTITL